MSDTLTRSRQRLALCLLLLIPVGLGTKINTGPATSWVQGHLGGILYVMFWITAVAWVTPTLSPWTAAGAVLIVTYGLEFLQLWSPPTLQAMRETFASRVLLGNTFDGWDLLHYALGAGAGALLVQVLTRPVPE